MKYLVLFFFLMFAKLNFARMNSVITFSGNETYLAIRDVPMEDTLSDKRAVAKEKSKVSEEEMKGEEASVNFMSSWKFYFIMLVFPVMLLLILIAVYRGKRS